MKARSLDTSKIILFAIQNGVTYYLDDATDCPSSVSSPIDDSISDDVIDDVSVAVIVPLVNL